MTDPSIEAVKNAAGENHWWITRLDDQTIANVCEYAEAAAREMAKSVQELHRPMTNDELRDTWPGFVGVKRAVCAGCTDTGRLSWLDECETAKRVYPSEELDQ